MSDPQLIRGGGITAFVFDASQLGVYAEPVGSGQVLPVGPNDVLARSGAIAALDGAGFDRCGGQNLSGTDAQRYAQSQCNVPLFLAFDSRRGISIEGHRPTTGITVSVINGRATIANGAQIAPGASVAVQLWIPLVVNGENVAGSGGNLEERVGRAALAVLSPEKVALVQGQMSLRDFAEAIRRLGATHAGYTDGGGSTALVLPDAYYGSSERRRVATWIVANPSGGGSAVLLALGLAVAVGTGIYFATRPPLR